MLRRVPGQGLLRVRRDQSGDPLCILRLFIMVIFTLMQKIASRTQVFWPKRSQVRGVGAPWGRGGGRTRRGRGNKDEGLKVKPEHFGP